MAKARKSPPAPEMLQRGGKWRVIEPQDGKVGTDLAQGVMAVPTDDSLASEYIRRHEMARLTWSPDAVPNDPYVQAFEEARLNLNLKRVGLSTETGREAGVTSAMLTQSVMTNRLSDAVLTRVALAGCSDEAEAAQALSALDADMAKASNEALTKLRRNPTWNGVNEAAEYLRKRLTLSKRPKRPKATQSVAGAASEGEVGSSEEPVEAPPTKLVLPPSPKPKEAPAKPKPKEQDGPERKKKDDRQTGHGPVSVKTFVPEEGRMPSLKAPAFTPGDGFWGEMTVVIPPMPLRLPRKVGRGKWRPADSGAHPRRMERWASDMAVFSTKGRQRSGSILIDGSGSMSLSHDQILKILLEAPAATVAMYAGSSETGKLWLLARRGRRVAEIPRRPTGNTVDGPALRWLARQKPPRLWVSDEGVHGRNDRGSAQGQNLYDDCRNICRVFGIKIVKNVPDAIRIMGGAKQVTGLGGRL